MKLAILCAFSLLAPHAATSGPAATSDDPLPPPSVLALYFHGESAAPSRPAAEAALAGSKPEEPGPDSELWRLGTASGELSLERKVWDDVMRPARIDEVRFRAAELAVLQGEHLVLILSTDLGGGGMPRLHQQLRDLVRSAEALGLDEPLAVCDASGLRWHPPQWITRMTASEAGPAPSSTFLIHAVHDTAEDGEPRYWLHTHGVARLTGFELGCVDVRAEHVDALRDVVESAASFAVDFLDWPEREPLEVLHGLELARLPWREGVAALAPRTVGTEDDHVDGHQLASILAVREGEQWRCPGEAAAALEMLIAARSRRETERGALAARETYAALRAWKRQARTEDRVLVKAPLEVEGGDREHVWFEVTRLDRAKVKAALLSQPHGRAALTPGDPATLDVAELSGWMVQTETGNFGPDELEALVVASSGK